MVIFWSGEKEQQGDVTWFLFNKKKLQLIIGIPRWWFQIFFMFTPIWGNDPIWLVFFRWVGSTIWNHQLGYSLDLLTGISWICTPPKLKRPSSIFWFYPPPPRKKTKMAIAGKSPFFQYEIEIYPSLFMVVFPLSCSFSGGVRHLWSSTATPLKNGKLEDIRLSYWDPVPSWSLT